MSQDVLMVMTYVKQIDALFHWHFKKTANKQMFVVQHFGTYFPKR